MNLFRTTKKELSTLQESSSKSTTTNRKSFPKSDSTPAKGILEKAETCEREKSKEGFFRRFIKGIKDVLTLVKFIALLYKFYRYRHFVTKVFWIIVTAVFGESSFLSDGVGLTDL